MNHAKIFSRLTPLPGRFSRMGDSLKQSVMKEALRTGTRDARLLYHSGMIANALGERRNAAKDLQLALKLNPDFNLRQATIAKNTLESLFASIRNQTSQGNRTSQLNKPKYPPLLTGTVPA